MKYPSLTSYQEVIQTPSIAFSDPELRECRPEVNNWGVPRAASGGFALTFHLLSPTKEWAVRCFHKDISGLETRYRCISSFLRSNPSERFVGFEYQPTGLLVEGTFYPLVKMEWVQGKLLNEYVESVLKEPLKLRGLRDDFRALVNELDQMGIAHGDLQHGNILVSDRMRLVDYDGMYVPGISLCSSDIGHVNYQHPARRGADFDARIDRFSSLVIYLALLALENDPSLWPVFDNGENLLFRAQDFHDPSSSDLFRRLHAIDKTRVLAERLERVCRLPVNSVPRLDDFLGQQPVAIQVPVMPPDLHACRRHQYPVVLANDVLGLAAHIGDVVEVVGRVVDVYQSRTRLGAVYALLNFGAKYPGNTFTCPVWERGLEALAAQGKVPSALLGETVSVVGLLESYTRRGRTIPEIQVDNARMIRVLTADEANELLAAATSPGLQPDNRVTNTELASMLRGDSIKSASPIQPPKPPRAAHSAACSLSDNARIAQKLQSRASTG